MYMCMYEYIDIKVSIVNNSVAIIILSKLFSMVWGGRREEGSGWGTHVYLCRIHFDIWQN